MKSQKLLLTPIILVCSIGLAGTVSAANVDALVKKCADCHEKDGNSTHVDTPSIAGMSAAYFADSMKGYKSGARPALKLKNKKDDMKGVAGKLSDEDVKALAGYYGKQKFMAYKQDFNAEQAKQGKALHKQYCDKCHSSGGTSSEDDAGILAGQPVGYLKYSLDNYANGKREMGEKMSVKFKAMMEAAGKDGITQLIQYYASQQ